MEKRRFLNLEEQEKRDEGEQMKRWWLG